MESAKTGEKMAPCHRADTNVGRPTSWADTKTMWLQRLERRAIAWGMSDARRLILLDDAAQWFDEYPIAGREAMLARALARHAQPDAEDCE